MTLSEEYQKQNEWRDWERYFDKLPLSPEQIVYDLGCSIGAVTRLFSQRVKKVVGFDNDKLLLDIARRQELNNCDFILDNIFTLNPSKLEKCNGVWMSFTLAYMEDPILFISNWINCLNNGGWFALVDIDGLFSSHLPSSNKYFHKIDCFEKEAEQRKVYDFRIGRKIKNIMEQNGLEIIVAENDWYDRELNFKGKATSDIYKNWTARLERMVYLKSFLGTQYADFSNNFLNTIQQESHATDGGVKYYVGIKK